MIFRMIDGSTKFKGKYISALQMITFDPVYIFGHSKGHFGVVFQGQSKSWIKSAVTVQISWLQYKYHCIFWYTRQNQLLIYQSMELATYSQNKYSKKINISTHGFLQLYLLDKVLFLVCNHESHFYISETNCTTSIWWNLNIVFLCLC